MTAPQLKVLVHDDQESVVDALRLLFEVHGIPVEAVASADALVERVGRDDVGVILQDMNFSPAETSGREGVTLYRRIREADPQVPVLLITAWASLETAVQLVKEGASDYISKPWDDAKLVATVQSLLRLRSLQLENERLRGERGRDRQDLAARHDLCGLVYDSEAMHRVVTLALNVADSEAPVMLCGPSGAGKEKIAEIIRANSPRREGPFVRVNLGALPEELMESELFGAEPGAYTGSKTLSIGRFEAADGGTLFLDEIDALSLAGQVKLLRVAQSGEFQRLGSSRSRHSDTRILSATNADLPAAIAAGRFREDLFYRLNVVELRVPALAERAEDVLPLARHFLAARAGGEPPALTPAAAEALRDHAWPGNVRELQNRVQRAVLLARGRAIEAADLGLPAEAAGPAASGETDAASTPAALDPAERAERRRLEAALTAADGVVARAAEDLGVSRQALYRRMARLGIVLERRPRD